MDNISKIARNIMADYTADDTPRVYVGTYAKYNNGNLGGQWVDLDQFSDEDDFLEYCQELHKDEDDPEFMFQDYENFPEKYYSESKLDDELWEYLDKINDVDKDLVDFIIDNGYDLDDADDVMIYNNCGNMGQVAYDYIQETGGLQNLGEATLKNYFDYDAYGRDMEMEGTFLKYGNGYIEIMR